MWLNHTPATSSKSTLGSKNLKGIKIWESLDLPSNCWEMTNQGFLNCIFLYISKTKDKSLQIDYKEKCKKLLASGGGGGRSSIEVWVPTKELILASLSHSSMVDFLPLVRGGEGWFLEFKNSTYVIGFVNIRGYKGCSTGAENITSAISTCSSSTYVSSSSSSWSSEPIDPSSSYPSFFAPSSLSSPSYVGSSYSFASSETASLSTPTREAIVEGTGDGTAFSNSTIVGSLTP